MKIQTKKFIEFRPNAKFIKNVIHKPNLNYNQRECISMAVNEAKKDGIELLIETDAGKLISIIQEISSYNYSKNQRVRIIKRNGKSRVVPFE